MNSGKLYLVATPIGNLEDITLRALRILKEAHLIACEDTRRTKQLCRHFEIKTPLISYHEHNERSRAEQLIDKMNNGLNIALVSDAGTPAISDPGTIVVQKAIASGITVVPIPGPVAFVTALIASGLDASAFVFGGFLPRKPKDRRLRLQHFLHYTETLIFYVSPHRYTDVIKDMYKEYGGARQVVVARELTKVHETFLGGQLQDISILEYQPQGEICVIIEGGSGEEVVANVFNNLSVEDHYTQYLEQGLDRKEAMKQVAKDRGMRRNEVYEVLLKNKD